MSNVDTLLRRLRKQRERWVELTPAQGSRPARAVCYLLPRPLEVARQFVRVTRTPAPAVAGDGAAPADAAADETSTELRVEVADVAAYACAWRGVLESDFVGAAGGSDEAPFDKRLWEELAQLQPAWAAAVAQHMLEQILERLRREDDDLKNSLPG